MEKLGGSWFLTHQSAQGPRERHVVWPTLSQSTEHRSRLSGCFGELAVSLHPRVRIALGKAGWKWREGAGKERGNKMWLSRVSSDRSWRTEGCIFVKWPVCRKPDYHLLLVALPPPPTRGGCGGKFYCWMRGSLESEHVGFSWQLPCWGILNTSIKASSLERVPGKGLWVTEGWEWKMFMHFHCLPGVGCGTLEGGSERSQRPSRTRGICFRGWGMKLWSLCHLLQVPRPSVCFGS